MELLTIEETAPIFKITKECLRKLIQRKKHPFDIEEMVTKVGGSLLIRKHILDKFIAGEIL